MEYKEDYNVISPDNKIWDEKAWKSAHDENYAGGASSKNPYPVWYLKGRPVFEGDMVLMVSNNRTSKPNGYEVLTREIQHYMRNFIGVNGLEHVKDYFWDIGEATELMKKKNMWPERISSK